MGKQFERALIIKRMAALSSESRTFSAAVLLRWGPPLYFTKWLMADGVPFPLILLRSNVFSKYCVRARLCVVRRGSPSTR